MQMNIGLFLLRLTVGLTLAAHGSQKLFGWLGGTGLSRIFDEPGRTRTSNLLISPGMSQSFVFKLFPVSYLMV